MNDRIILYGNIGFEPEDHTRKHKDQAAWKKIAMVFIDGDICEYYAWFLKRRYNIVLNKPLRGAHISFINDSMRDLTQKGQISEESALELWETCKQKWDGKEIQIVLDLNPKTDDRSWWLNIPQDERELLHEIRAELGLGRPHFGLHMSMGYARPGLNEIHSKYIHDCIKKGFITN
jgi:hypothetical protein